MLSVAFLVEKFLELFLTSSFLKLCMVMLWECSWFGLDPKIPTEPEVVISEKFNSD
jgi:hypothetical protein